MRQLCTRSGLSCTHGPLHCRAATEPHCRKEICLSKDLPLQASDALWFRSINFRRQEKPFVPWPHQMLICALAGTRPSSILAGGCKVHSKRILCWLTMSHWQMSIMKITGYWITTSGTCLAAWELALLFRLRSDFTAVKLDFVLLQKKLWPEAGPTCFSQRFRIM